MNLKNLCLAIAVLVAAAFVAQAAMGTIAKAQDDSLILTRLNEILRGQQAIASDMASIKSEINIIKIRVTQLQ